MGFYEEFSDEDVKYDLPDTVLCFIMLGLLFIFLYFTLLYTRFMRFFKKLHKLKSNLYVKRKAN